MLEAVAGFEPRKPLVSAGFGEALKTLPDLRLAGFAGFSGVSAAPAPQA